MHDFMGCQAVRTQLQVLGLHCVLPSPQVAVLGLGAHSIMRPLPALGLKVGVVSDAILFPSRWFSQVAKTLSLRSCGEISPSR